MPSPEKVLQLRFGIELPKQTPRGAKSEGVSVSKNKINDSWNILLTTLIRRRKKQGSSLVS